MPEQPSIISMVEYAAEKGRMLSLTPQQCQQLLEEWDAAVVQALTHQPK